MCFLLLICTKIEKRGYQLIVARTLTGITSYLIADQPLFKSTYESDFQVGGKMKDSSYLKSALACIGLTLRRNTKNTVIKVSSNNVRGSVCEQEN